MDYIYFNKNPYNKHVGDCVYRAIAYFFNEPWKNSVMRAVRNAIVDGCVNFNYTTNIVSLMEKNGYKRIKVHRKGLTVRDFGEFTKKGETYMVHIVKPRHMTIIDDCDLYDIWDCRDCVMDYYFKKTKYNEETTAD